MWKAKAIYTCEFTRRVGLQIDGLWQISVIKYIQVTLDSSSLYLQILIRIKKKKSV